MRLAAIALYLTALVVLAGGFAYYAKKAEQSEVQVAALKKDVERLTSTKNMCFSLAENAKSWRTSPDYCTLLATSLQWSLKNNLSEVLCKYFSLTQTYKEV